MCFEIFFAECKKNNTRQISSLPSVKKKHSAKKLFAECQKKHSAKAALPSAQNTTLGKPPGTRQRAGLR